MNEQTKLWLEIYPNIRECSIQTFNDQKKEGNTNGKIWEMTDANLDQCVKLQKEKPCGVFFSVNPMEKGKRDAKSVKFIQTRICDIDTGDKQAQLKLIREAPLQPSLVVESSHGFHLYYLAFDGDNITKEQYENGNFGLCNYYNGDTRICKDIARVLRLPGYFHMKADPVEVKLRTDLCSGDRYHYWQIEKAFPNQIEWTEATKKQTIASNEKLNEKDSFRVKASELNSKMMLEELNGTEFMRGDSISFKHNSNGTEQIFANGKSTGCWIDLNGMIGSSNGGGPTWIQWIKWYGPVNWKELARILVAKHPELKKERFPRFEVVELKENKLIDESIEPDVPDFTRGEEGIDNHLGKLSKGEFVVLVGETGAGKTTFATFMARKNKNACYLALEDTIENIARRYATRYSGITIEEYNNRSRSEEKKQRYRQGYNAFMSSGVNMIDIGKKINIEQLMEEMKSLKAKGYEMFFIDNLGFIDALGEGATEERKTAEISRNLVSFALDQNVCVVLINHFKKAVREGDARGIGQMRGSGKVGDDATTVIQYERKGDDTYLNVRKSRKRGKLKSLSILYDRGDFIFIDEVDV